MSTDSALWWEELQQLEARYLASEGAESVKIMKALCRHLEKTKEEDDRLGLYAQYAISNGDVRSLKFLCNGLIDVNSYTTYLPRMSLLQLAAQTGKIACIRFLLENGADIKLCYGKSFEPILLAADAGHVDAVRILLDAGAEIDRLRPFSFPYDYDFAKEDAHDEEEEEKVNTYTNVTPLIAAASADYPEIIKLLLERGAELDLPDTAGRTALWHAVIANARKSIKLLLDVGANVNMKDKRGYTPLHLSSFASPDVRTMKRLLSAGANTKARNIHMQTPLHTAAIYGTAEQVDVLLRAGADPRAKDSSNLIPLWSCVSNPNASSIRRVLKKFGGEWTVRALNKSNCRNTYPLFAKAVLSCTDHGFLQELIDDGAEINIKYPDGTTPLILAVRARNESAVRFLLKKGADPNMSNEDQATPLMLSLVYHNDRCTLALLEHGVDLSKTDHFHLTALDYAILQESRKKIFLALLDAGANVNTADILGNTAVFRATKCKESFYLRELVKRGANVNTVGDGSVSPIFLAVMTGRSAAVRILLDAGANANERLPEGESLLSYAVHSGSLTITRYILDAMPNSPSSEVAVREALIAAQKSHDQSIIKLLKKKSEMPKSTSVPRKSET